MTTFWMIIAILGWFGAILLLSILIFVLTALGGMQAEYLELEKKLNALLDSKKSSTSVWSLRKEVPFSD